MLAYIKALLAGHLLYDLLELVLIHPVVHPDLGLAKYLPQGLASPLDVSLNHFENRGQGSEGRESVNDPQRFYVLFVIRFNVHEFNLTWLLGRLELLEEVHGILEGRHSVDLHTVNKELLELIPVEFPV